MLSKQRIVCLNSGEFSYSRLNSGEFSYSRLNSGEFSYSRPGVVWLLAWAVLGPARATLSAEPPRLGLYLHLAWSKSDAALKRIIPAASRLGYDCLVLEIGGNVELEAQPGLGGAWGQEDIRELLALARAHHLEAIPCASLLGHAECTPRQPQYVDPDLGLRLWEPGVYEFLDRYVAEVCDLFDHPRYFHARMDESQAVIEEGSKRLGMTPAQFLADHIKRVEEIVRRQGARLILYHDMLLPGEEVAIGTALGGAPLNCWRAVEEIPRDVIINFWLYQFWSAHAGAIDFFTRRGFEVWLSPWLSPEPMAQWAAEHDRPLVQTTWCDPTGLAWYEANLRAVVLGAAYRRTPDLGDRFALPFDPLLRGVQALSVPVQIDSPAKQIDLPQEAGTADPQILADWPEKVEFGGLSLNVQPRVLRQPQQTLDDRLQAAKQPLKVIRPDGQEHLIAGVNRGRGEAEIILYTPAFGLHTGTNMFGGEVVILDNVVQEVSGDVWGAGGYVIPPGGCVLSGHGSGDVPEFLSQFGRLQPVRLVDGDGRDLLTAPPDDSTFLEGFRVPITAGKPVRAIWLLHATLREMALRLAGDKVVKPLVGEVVARTETGEQRFEVRFRRDVASWRVARWLLDDQGRPAENVQLAWAEARGYGDVRCLWATRLVLEEPERLVSLSLRPTPAGMAAGWLVAAAAVEEE